MPTSYMGATRTTAKQIDYLTESELLCLLGQPNACTHDAHTHHSIQPLQSSVRSVHSLVGLWKNGIYNPADEHK